MKALQKEELSVWAKELCRFDVEDISGAVDRIIDAAEAFPFVGMVKKHARAARNERLGQVVR